MAKYPPIPGRLLKIDALTRLDHYHLCEEDDCYYLWEWDAAPYSESATTDFIGNFQREMRFKDKYWPWHFKKQAILYAAKAIATTMLPDWRTSTFVPVPPSKIKTDAAHDPRLLVALQQVTPALDIQELVVQTVNTQSREKNIPPSARATNWQVELDRLRESPRHFVVFDDLLTGASHFAAMKLVLGRTFPGVAVTGLFLARRLRRSIVEDPSI